MNFEAIDVELEKWVAENRLELVKRYRDDDIRSVNISSSQGSIYQIWVDGPVTENVTVMAWDYGERRHSERCRSVDITAALDNALRIVRTWEAKR